MLETELLPIKSLIYSDVQCRRMTLGSCTDFDELLPPEVKANIRDPNSIPWGVGIMSGILGEIELKGAIGLLPLLWACYSLDTTDPLDRVYALRALTADEDVTYPDYTLTTEQLLLTLARSFVRKDQAADVLVHAGLVHNEGYATVPSWCPIWDRSRSTASSPFYLVGYEVGDFHAAGLTIPQVRFVDNDEKLLKVSGAAIDTVQSVTAVALISYMNEPWRVHLQAVETLRASAPPQTMSRAEFESMLASLNQTLNSDSPLSYLAVSDCFAIESLLQLLLSSHVALESFHKLEEPEYNQLQKVLYDL